MASFLEAHVKAAQLRDRAAGAKVHTERQAAFTNKVEAYLGLQNLAREERRLDNDRDPASPCCGHIRYDEVLRPSNFGITLPHRPLLYPPLQQQYGHLDPPEPRLNCRPHHNPRLCAAANEELDFGRRDRRPGHGLPQYDTADAKPEFGERGRPLYRDSHPYDTAAKDLQFGLRGRRPDRDPLSYHEADKWPEYGRHGRRRNYSSPPDRAADDQFIFHDEQHGRNHTHRPENDQLSFSSGYMGLGDYDGGSFSDMYLGPPSPHCRREVHTSRDMSPHHFENFKPRLADYVPTLASGTLRPKLDTLKDFPWADYAWSSDTGNQDTMRNFREAPTRPPLNPRRTGYRSGIGFHPLREPTQDELTGTLRRLTLAETSRGAFRDEMHDEVDAAERNQQRLTTQLNQPYPPEEVKSEHPRRGHRERRHPPIPHVARPGPLVTQSYDAVMASRSLNTLPYDPVTPSQLPSKAQLPNDADHVCNASAMPDRIGYGSTIELLPRNEQHAHPDPNSDSEAEMDITTHESVPSHTDLNIPCAAARDNPHDIAYSSQASAGETHSYESSDSDSGYDTPDDDDDDDDDHVEGSRADDENTQGAETLIRIQL